MVHGSVHLYYFASNRNRIKSHLNKMLASHTPHTIGVFCEALCNLFRTYIMRVHYNEPECFYCDGLRIIHIYIQVVSIKYELHNFVHLKEKVCVGAAI